MKFIATALKNDIAIWASMPSTETRYLGDSSVQVPSSKRQWVNIPSGKNVEVGLVVGIHPSALSNLMPTSINGVKMILLDSYSAKTLPQDFHGVLRLDVSDE